MTNLRIRNFCPADIPAINELQQQYAQKHPGAIVVPGEAYCSDSYQEGANIFCLEDSTGRLMAYAPLFPILAVSPEQPNQFWAEIRVSPDCIDPTEARQQLYTSLRARMAALAVSGSPAGCRLSFQYLPNETDSITFVQSQGLLPGEATFKMVRNLAAPLPPIVLPEGINLRRLRLDTAAEQLQYLTVRNQALPQAAKSPQDLAYFLHSPYWQSGAVMAGFAGDALVAGVMMYWSEADRQAGADFGFTEYIFTAQEWRGQGIARGLISAGLAYLREYGLKEARLEVSAENENALGLYTRLGFAVIETTQIYSLAW